MPRSISAIRCTSRAITTSSRASVNLANRHDPNLNLARLPESLMQHIGINTNDFQLYPDFFDAKQQSTLLSSALALMNRKASVEERSHLRAWRSRNRGYKTAPGSFLPDEAYAFEQSHFDTVITGFRERTVTNWPLPAEPEEASLLPSLLANLYSLLPAFTPVPPFPPPYSNTPDRMPQDVIDVPNHLLMHLLHMSSEGQIFPHVDNIQASGQTIVGVSLGSARVMRFDAADGSEAGFEVLVKPGSAYIQNASIRYKFKHSLPLMADWDGQEIGGQQRLSIMLRDKLSNASASAGMAAA